MYILRDCEPKKVFHYFEQISRIPRGSGNEKAVSDYILAFALERGLFAVTDKANNLIIRKPATAGYESAETVILQGHLDMVCEKNKAVDHDFLKDPIRLYVDGDFIRAEGTTLGADNGIAVAMAMAILDSDDFPHPPLEIVLTTDEETGMYGAAALSAADLTGTRLINIDTEEEGVFTSSCAGGSKASLTIPIDYIDAPPDYAAFVISVSGLKGGHSGMDIDKERANSNRILGRILDGLLDDMDIYIEKISGGSKDNAIPRESEMTVLTEKIYSNMLIDKISEFGVQFRHEYFISDNMLQISIKPYEKEITKVFSKDTSKSIAAALMLLPNGVCAMSAISDGLVETSNNIGVVKTNETSVIITCAARSNVASRKRFILRQIESIARTINAANSVKGDYPAWEYTEDSVLRDIFTKTYSEMYGKEPKIHAVHAGLECGLFAQKIKHIDMISFGPDIFDVHTPDERLSISSVGRSWAFLLRVLANLRT